MKNIELSLDVELDNFGQFAVIASCDTRGETLEECLDNTICWIEDQDGGGLGHRWFNDLSGESHRLIESAITEAFNNN